MTAAPAAAPLRRRAAEGALVFLAFALLTVAMTWPWAARLGSACSDPGDPYLNSWILWWDYHQTFTSPLHLFDAPLFFPHRDTLAYSENFWGIAALVFPAFALGARPLAAHGLATLLGFALSGFGAYRLARTLTGSAGAAWVAGIAFGFAAYRFHQLSHLTYLFAGFMALLFEAAVLFAREPTRRRAAWFGAAFFLNGVSVIHWFVLSLIPLGATLLLVAGRHGTLARRELSRRGAAALAVAGLALLPFFLPYLRLAREEGLVRAESNAAAYSARPAHWLTADWRSPVWRGLGRDNVADELCLFPGLLVPLLAAAALSRPRDDAFLPGAVLAVTGFLGSLGMNFPFHRLLFAYVPLFRSIRVPARWAMVANLGLAVLAGLGALALAAALGRRRPKAAAAVYVALAAALLLELRQAPLHLFAGEPDPDALTERLATLPMTGGLVELPSGGTRGNYLYVLRAADHQKPLVNAVSGFATPEVLRIEELTRRRPVPDELLDLFESIPVSYVTVREAWLLPDERGALREFLSRGAASGRLRFQGRLDERLGADLWAVARTEPGAPGGLPLPWSSPAAGAAPSGAPLRGPEDPSLAGGLNDAEPGPAVRGELVVAGWARIPGEDLEVTILIDGEERTPLTSRRVPRDDVARALPRMGDCRSAGFEARYAPRPGDAGTHELLVFFRARDGRFRPYPIRRFHWSP
ncbi:MAG TPA: hypothetical protein PK598_02120 [Thermoanaerobaculia bacterium]|nr:hypothetical protein [Thermoanaerobaculia bacterium]